jgi:hypothetical protein
MDLTIEQPDPAAICLTFRRTQMYLMYSYPIGSWIGCSYYIDLNASLTCIPILTDSLLSLVTQTCMELPAASPEI